MSQTTGERRTALPPELRESLEPDEQARFAAELEDRSVVATDDRLLVHEGIGVSAVDYDDVTSVRTVTERERSRRFWVGVVLMALSVPGLIQGSTGALVLFPLGAIVALWGYDRSEHVAITTTHRDAPLRFAFENPQEAADRIASLRRG